MEGNKTMVPSSPSDTKLTNGKQYSSPDDLEIETFYVKLTQVLDSTGFNLMFNVRETSLDLYLLYLEVTRRGGFHQIALQNKWNEVVSLLKLEGNSAMLSIQVESLYAILLYKFEKLYFSGSPKGAGCQESRVLLQAPSNDKEKKKLRVAPTGKTGYQIFLKKECARLKAHDPYIDGKKVLRLAVDAWQKMSVAEKQPYVEESKKLKETNKEAMIVNDNKQKRPSVCGDSYCVTSQPLTNYSVINNAAVNFEMTEETLKNPFLPVDFDTYCSIVR